MGSVWTPLGPRGVSGGRAAARGLPYPGLRGGGEAMAAEVRSRGGAPTEAARNRWRGSDPTPFQTDTRGRPCRASNAHPTPRHPTPGGSWPYTAPRATAGIAEWRRSSGPQSNPSRSQESGFVAGRRPGGGPAAHPTPNPHPALTQHPTSSAQRPTPKTINPYGSRRRRRMCFVTTYRGPSQTTSSGDLAVAAPEHPTPKAWSVHHPRDPTPNAQRQSHRPLRMEYHAALLGL